MALNQSPFPHTVSLFTKMKGKLGHRDPPAVKQIIKWQFALKQFAISSVFFSAFLHIINVTQAREGYQLTEGGSFAGPAPKLMVCLCSMV